MSATRSTRRTQADRRAASRRALLESACRHFGARGYAETSLEDIAADCGLTIRPIYHYFGSKESLFAAVNARMEQRVADAIAAGAGDDAGIRENWRAFAALCEDPSFRRILLVDGPAVLGRAHWSSATQGPGEGEGAGSAPGSATAEAAPAAASASTAPAGSAPEPSPEQAAQAYRAALLNRVVMAAFAEAALMLAEAEGADLPRRVTEDLMVSLFSRLRGSLTVPATDSVGGD